jgi:hypothetical protein
MAGMTTQDSRPSVMERGGYYNRNSSLQANAASTALGLLELAAAAIPLEGDGPVRVVDYGSSQGRNSIAPMRIAIDAIRRRAGASRPIEVVHTDLPDNDFAALFSLITEDPASYLRDDPRVFPAAIGNSYFRPLFAPGTVHLAWNSITLHWLSRAPLRPAAGFHLVDLTDPADVAARDRQLAEDWLNFLSLRNDEFRPGGRFVGAILARDGDDIGWPVMRVFLDGIGRAFSEGMFSAAEADRLLIPLAFRSAVDLRAPFAAQGRFRDLVLEHLEIVRLGDPFFEEMQLTGDHARYARTWANVCRAIYAPLLVGIMDPGRDGGAVLDTLFSRLERELRERPVENYFMQANVLIRRL